MTFDLAGMRDGTPERFDPGTMAGQLVEVEHLARYWWAAQLVAGRTALDAGCGVAYGTAALARAGATRAVGVDLAAEVLEAVEPDMPEGVELRAADVRELPFADGTFDVVVCFEVIEHVEEQDRVLDELARVVADDGILLVSSPNREVYVPGNPHHVREYLPDELRQAVARRFANVELVRQHDATASLLVPDGSVAGRGPDGLAGTTVGSVLPFAPGREPYTVAVASDAPLPGLPSGLCLTDTVEIRDWAERFAAQHETLTAQHHALAEMRSLEAHNRALADELIASEQAAARIIDVEQRVEELEQRCRDLVADKEKLQERLDAAGRIIDDMAESASWRVTRPLREVKQRVRPE